MRESLGTVRLHRFTCDVCSRQVESRSKASGTIPMPEGWSHLKLQHGNVSSEADVCSPDCARDFATSALEQMGAPDAPAS